MQKLHPSNYPRKEITDFWLKKNFWLSVHCNNFVNDITNVTWNYLYRAQSRPSGCAGERKTNSPGL